MKQKSFFAAFLLLFCATSLWASDTSVDGIWYKFDSSTKTASVTFRGNNFYSYYDEYSGTVVIPSSVTYDGTSYSVTSIGEDAFNKCSDLISITIPNSVTSIGKCAFAECTGLTSITIPNSVTNIDRANTMGCFYGCSNLTSVIWNSKNYSSPSDGISAPFYDIRSQITSFVFGDEVRVIPAYLCYGMKKLTSVTIPNNVTRIRESAFRGCSGLTSITWNPKNYSSPSSYSDAPFNDISSQITSFIFGDEVEVVPAYLCNYMDNLTSITIPSSITSIGREAFNSCIGLLSVTIPNSVTNIGNFAFYNCSGLTSIIVDADNTSYDSRNNCNCIIQTSTNILITGCQNASIPNGVTGIASYAFGGCSGLSSITIPNSVTNIGKGAFYGCSRLPVENNIRYADTYLVEAIDKSLSAYTIKEGVKWIGSDAFSQCINLTSITIPNSVTSIDGSAFNACSSLTSVTINSNTIASKEYSSNSNLSTIFGTQVTEYKLGDNVTGIGHYAFYNCSSLTSFTIPNSVTSIGSSAFGSCSSLTSVMMQCNTPPTLGNNAFSSYYLSGIYVPCGTLDSYKQQWAAYSSIIKYLPAIYTITGKINISGAGNVTTSANLCEGQVLAKPKYGYHFVQWSDGNTDNPRIIELTQDTTFTAEFAVDKSGTCGDNNLLTWQFDDACKTLVVSGNGTLNSNYTFGVEAPTQTERLIIEEGVTSIGNNAFKDKCSTITTLALPSTVTAIGNYAFAGLSNRKFNTLVLPNTIISIGAHAFDGASYLQTIHFGSVLEEIGDYAFNGCTRVREMTCLAEITPNVGTDGLTSISDLVELYVPNDYLFDYQLDNNWKRFVLKPIGATETTVTSNEVTIVADENTATITWPTSEADSYTIEITKDGEVFCRLIFNANGQLTGIAFAPSRNGQAQAPAATMTACGMQFTVTGLNSGTNYGYKLEAKSGSATVASYTGTFATAAGIVTALIPVESSAIHGGATKLLQGGQLLILRNGKTYTVQGQEVR